MPDKQHNHETSVEETTAANIEMSNIFNDRNIPVQTEGTVVHAPPNAPVIDIDDKGRS